MSTDKEIFLSFSAAAGLVLGVWALGYMVVDTAIDRGIKKGQQQVREEAISFGAAHRGPKGQFIWGPVTKRGLEVAR